MLTKKQEEAFCKAMTKRLNWYEDILDYGEKRYKGCYICLVVEKGCFDCPLNTKGTTIGLHGCMTFEREDALDSVGRIIENKPQKGDRTIVRDYYKSLIKRIEKRGYEYK